MNVWDHIVEAAALAEDADDPDPGVRVSFQDHGYKLAQTHALIAIAWSLAKMANIDR